MPVANIIDDRDQPYNTRAFIVAEPSFADNGIAGATQHKETKTDFTCKELGRMTVGDAIKLFTNDPVEITLYLYSP